MPTSKPTITIVTKNGAKRIRAQWANDKWAVHRTYLKRGHFTTRRCWTLTHRASGQAIIKHIDWRDARSIIQKLEVVVKQADGLFTDGMCGCDLLS